MLKVYLGGHVKEVEYRDYTIEKYGDRVDLFEPVREMDRKLPKINMKAFCEGKMDIDDDVRATIVETELDVIKFNTDIVVAYMTKMTTGTIMEIKHAYDHDVPVYVIDPEKKFRKDLWLKYHTNLFFNSIDDCFKHILTM